MARDLASRYLDETIPYTRQDEETVGFVLRKLARTFPILNKYESFWPAASYLKYHLGRRARLSKKDVESEHSESQSPIQNELTRSHLRETRLPSLCVGGDLIKDFSGGSASGSTNIYPLATPALLLQKLDPSVDEVIPVATGATEPETEPGEHGSHPDPSAPVPLNNIHPIQKFLESLAYDLGPLKPLFIESGLRNMERLTAFATKFSHMERELFCIKTLKLDSFEVFVVEKGLPKLIYATDTAQ